MGASQNRAVLRAAAKREVIVRPQMVIGVDFDNTIVCYDDVFHRVALEQGLIPATVPASKREVRGYLEQCGKANAWTELQGWVYGVRLQTARPFPGVLEFFRSYVRSGACLCIVSHKTRYPALGPAHDLHEAAHQWLEVNGFYDPGQIGLSRDRVYFELSQQAKVDRIAQVSCTFFIDDLPEVLTNPDLPVRVHRILFDPHGQFVTKEDCSFERFYPAASWREIRRFIQCRKPPS